MTAAYLIREANDCDGDTIARIYNHYIVNTIVTFEVDEVSGAEMSRRMERVQQESYPWLVAEQDGQVVGYSCASQWHGRSAYRHSAETTVYLDPDFVGHGLGSALYSHLIDELIAQKNFHTIIGGIALPNESSVALHEKFGFIKAAYYKEVGYKFDRWIDVGYWQRML